MHLLKSHEYTTQGRILETGVHVVCNRLAHARKLELPVIQICSEILDKS